MSPELRAFALALAKDLRERATHQRPGYYADREQILQCAAVRETLEEIAGSIESLVDEEDAIERMTGWVERDVPKEEP